MSTLRSVPVAVLPPVMAQIAAHLVNVKVLVVLSSSPLSGRPRTNRHLGRRGPEEQKPAIGVADDPRCSSPPPTTKSTEQLRVATRHRGHRERMDWKRDWPLKIVFAAPHAIVASNTRGCRSPRCPRLPSRDEGASAVIHFFNPPRRLMQLVELIPDVGQRCRHARRPTFVTCTTFGRGALATRPTSSPTAWARRACWPPSSRPPSTG